jgi:hypothetical protein
MSSMVRGKVGLVEEEAGIVSDWYSIRIHLDSGWNGWSGWIGGVACR